MEEDQSTEATIIPMFRGCCATPAEIGERVDRNVLRRPMLEHLRERLSASADNWARARSESGDLRHMTQPGTSRRSSELHGGGRSCMASLHPIKCQSRKESEYRKIL